MAQLCSEQFVPILVHDEKFLEGDYKAALESAYMKMDKYVVSDEGLKRLNEIVDQSNDEVDPDEDEDWEDLDEDEDGNEEEDGEDEDLSGDDGLYLSCCLYCV